MLHTTAPDFFRREDRSLDEAPFTARCAADLEALIEAEGAGTIAAFIAEPLLGTGGIVPPPAGYWAAIQLILKKHDILLIGDEVVFEQGQNGHSLDEPHHLFSGTKSFSCALFETLRQQDGLTAEEDVDLGLSKPVTVDQTLHLTSGQQQAPYRLGWDLLREEPRYDIYRETLGQPFLTEPGETFQYGSTHYNLFGAMVTQRYGDPVALLQERVFDPIGLRTAGWLRDAVGNPALSLGAWTTANEWAKFGVLMRDDGMFLGTRVLEPGLHDCFQGSSANPAYGRTFWLNQALGDDGQRVGSSMEDSGPILSNAGPADLVAAAGHDDQRLYIVPSQDLVIVRLSDGHRKFEDHALLAPFFE